MKFEDLSMTLEQVVDFAKNHNMFIEDDDHKHFSNDGILEYLKANRDRITFKPLYYYGAVSYTHLTLPTKLEV